MNGRIGLSKGLILLGVLGWAAAWTACDSRPRVPAMSAGGGAESESAARFQFRRAGSLLVRINTATGATSFARDDGDGGWAPVGQPPAADGRPLKPGRYKIYAFGGQRGLVESRVKVLRVDEEMGRAWSAELMDGAVWLAFAENGSEPEPAPQPAASPPTAPAAITPGEAKQTTADTQRLGIVSRAALEADPEVADEYARHLAEALAKPGITPDVKAWAARQLSVFPPEVAVPPLLEALQSEHPIVVVASVRALNELQDPSTIPHILKLQNHPDPSVRVAVKETVTAVR
ncbi:HEAT repeat domain-containing protein [Myxococcota bacterium]|nr:HEAT repeat domain-containing protein [Myxococcota bacterium]